MTAANARMQMMAQLRSGTDAQLMYAYRALVDTSFDRPLYDYEALTLRLVGAEMERRSVASGGRNPFDAD